MKILILTNCLKSVLKNSLIPYSQLASVSDLKNIHAVKYKRYIKQKFSITTRQPPAPVKISSYELDLHCHTCTTKHPLVKTLCTACGKNCKKKCRNKISSLLPVNIPLTKKNNYDS